LVTKTEAVKAFLSARTHNDLSSLYTHDMECQVIVAQDDGEKIEGDFEGVRWRGYSDGVQTWKPFRVPRQASTDPVYQDTEMTYDINIHAEGIGMTGWDWKQRVSKWVAYDFDAIVGHSDKHSQKLTPDELTNVRNIASELPWVTVRYSTSGKGLHLYVFLDHIPTQNHTEHAALARSILAKMSSLTGYDFKSKVDICGGNMWVWHRKMIDTNGLQLIKQGDVLSAGDVPPNWKEHTKIVRGVSKKLGAPTDITALQDGDERFEILAGQRSQIKLDNEHVRLIKFLNDNQLYHWWDSDHHMLVTHTASLKKAHTELDLKGIFETETKASTTHNCFMFPIRRGAWSVRRYSQGVKEHQSWDQDGSGYTRCYFNQEPTLFSAAAAYGGLEDPNGGFHFKTGEDASKAAIQLGANVTVPPKFHSRPVVLKQHKDNNRLVLEFAHEAHDSASDLPGWLQKGNKWIKIYSAQRIQTIENDGDNYDDLVRHLVTSAGDDSGWVINSDERWNVEPINHVRVALQSMSINKREIDSIVGSSVLKPWTLVSQPFQPEYPGDRIWNRNAPQLKFVPTISDTLHFPTWQSILRHVGQSLDSSLQQSVWAKRCGILTGADYLKTWIASMIQYPSEPLPYLFIYGEMQESGKSTLHEALSLLFYPGYVRVDHALQNKSTFNAELEGAICCVVEETDLNKNAMANERMKDWVTSPKLSIHRKSQTPYLINNTCHFIHTANYRKNCPIFPGDTRITMINVLNKPDNPVPKRTLFAALEKEAADFLGAIVTLEIPESDSRLRVPVIDTSDKISASQSNRTPLQTFLEEVCFKSPGSVVTLTEFYEKFQAWLDPSERIGLTKQKVSGNMPEWVPKGRLTTSSSWHWGNISFIEPTDEQSRQPMLVCFNDKLLPENEVKRA